MSNNLRRYVSERAPKESDGPLSSKRVGEMDVTAMVGPSCGDQTRGVQLTLENEYVQLTEQQAEDLAKLLLRRINPDDVVESTNSLGEFGTMNPDGSLERR